MPKYAVGVDFGTLSARALVAEIGTGRELGRRHDGLSPRRHDPRAARRHAAQAGLGASAPAGLSRLPRLHRAGGAAPERRRAGGRRRRRRGLHGEHVAAGRCRRCAAVPASRVCVRAACVADALEAPRRAALCHAHAGGRRGARRGVSGALWRQDFLRVAVSQALADPRRGAGDLRRRRPLCRGGRLDRVQAHRTGAPFGVDCRLQGVLAQARRLPVRGVLRRARSALCARGGRKAFARPVSRRQPRRAGWTNSAHA